MSERAKAVLLFVLAWAITMAFFAAMAWIFDRPPTAWSFFGSMAAVVTWVAAAGAAFVSGITTLERRP